MTRILLTNDDGVESPVLVLFARALAQIGEVAVVVPDRERSWVSKAITRHEPLEAERITVDDIEVWTCSGYPADAVQLAIHSLLPQPPDLVVSGINLGFNHGSGFLMSSGTVGAAVEAWIAGVPGIAFSTGSVDDWPRWRTMVWEPEALPRWERTSEVAADLTGDLLQAGVLDHADVVTVNLPFDPPRDVRRRVTTVARVGYDRLFKVDDDGRYVHDFGGGFRAFDSLEGTDVAAANQEEISITPLRIAESAALPPDVRDFLEAPGTADESAASQS